MASVTEKKKSPSNVVTFDAKQHILMAYATPILNTNLRGVDALNEGLKRIILEKKLKASSVTKSNVGGWHSETDLFMWDEPEIVALRSLVVSVTSQFIRETSDHTVENANISYDAWANVNTRGNYNNMHNHPGTHWSGVYYVDDGEDDQSRQNPASIEFQDPRGFVNMLPVPGQTFGKSLQIQPRPGKILIFPSFINHAVQPYLGDTARISIAFNVVIRMPEA